MDHLGESLGAERVPPQDLDAEQATLGAMLLGGDAVAVVAQICRAEDFYRDAHVEIGRACFELFDRGEPVDTVSVAAELRARGRLEALGGLDYLDRLQRSVPYSINAERYASVVKDKATLRELLFASRRIAQSCYDTETTAQDALDSAESQIMRLAEHRAATDFEHVNQLTMRVFDAAEAKFHQGATISGLSTGYADLDHYLAGLQAGDLVVLAARPSMGKTSLAVNFAMHATVGKPEAKPAGIFSLEMSKEQLVSGVICSQARVNLSRWRTGRFRNTDWEQIAESMNALAKAPLFIDDSSALSPIEMRARARRLKGQQGGLGLVVVDYLQLMRGNTRTDNRVNEISEITRSLKGMAKELEVPVVACAQLSRAVESRPNKRPMLSDLRESGQIEADADVVMFLYRDSYYKQRDEQDGEPRPVSDALDDEAPPDETECIIGKQRNGPTGMVRLGFLRQFKLFVNLARER